LALDEPSEKDEKYQDEDLTFVMEKDLAQKLPDIVIDYSDSWLGRGFKIRTSGGFRC